MFSLTRRGPSLFLRRSFADIVAAPSSTQLSANVLQPTTPAGLPIKGRIPVREDHGLYSFFRRKPGAELQGDARFETVETPESIQKLPSGRAWKASELRLKSFKDLHTLWYVVLRERNLLATQKEEARRLGVNDTQQQVNASRVHYCRKTMARIKAVINERRLAYDGAVKLAEAQREVHYDKIVLEEQQKHFQDEAKHLKQRRELRRERHQQLLAERAKLAEERAAAEAIQAAAAPTPTAEESVVQAQESESLSATVEAPEEPSIPPPLTATPVTPAKETPKVKLEPEPVFAEPRKTPPAKPIDTAAAGLFGSGTGSQGRD
ncbi:MRP-L47-domain-containing protein [Pluteus cervinus]|uniref:MRP-L47-domain-containing protein n=1 Tax=Pluteus cervinus TaxID=181527 RepID=A0ACD3AFV1_9AGAR|nr:MRP-L47-domain-containing protein [Pluteus cervinus]